MTRIKYDLLWGKEGLGRNFNFHALFSTLARRLVYDEQQRTPTSLLKFWMPFFISRSSRLFQVAVSPQARHSVPEKAGWEFSSPQPRILLLTCFFSRHYWQIAWLIIFPPPPPPSVIQYLEQKSIDYALDIDECATNTHKCSHENVTCLNTEGSFKCICKHGFSGDIYNCKGNEDCLERNVSS